MRRCPKALKKDKIPRHYSDVISEIAAEGAVMGIGIVGSPLAAVVLNATIIAAAQPITVFVHDHAHVNQTALQRAETEASRILGTGEVEVRWVNCARSLDAPEGCRKVPDSACLILLLLGAGATRYGTEASALGFALPPEGDWFGSYAGVLYDRVERLTSLTLTTPVVLGHAIAHELGHLLLGVGRHAPTGIMKAAWHRKELEMAKRGTLVFRDQERREIRENARRRIGKERESLRGAVDWIPGAE